jgi:3-methyladenine DNA glycosylase AlkD
MPSREIIAEMRELANPGNLEGMARFGIDTTAALGLTVPQIRAISRRAGRSQTLAEELWASGIHEARWLASLVADPQTITASTMDRWTRDFDSWDVCDACCCNLFDRTPHAWAKIPGWAADKREFVRRAAFSTIAALAVHDKAAPDRVFLGALPLIEKYAFDDRNFVRKAVNWALRNIGKRNARLLPAAIACAERIRDQGFKSARWIASDALRELRPKLEMLKFGIPSRLQPCKTPSHVGSPKSIPRSTTLSSRKRAGRTVRSN